MDKGYKEDIPAARRALEQLKVDLSSLDAKTDWARLRIAPLLQHVKSLQRVLDSPRFADEVSRLRRGVSMFHSDLVYLRENIKALKAIVEHERGRRSRGTGRSSAVGSRRSSEPKRA